MFITHVPVYIVDCPSQLLCTLNKAKRTEQGNLLGYVGLFRNWMILKVSWVRSGFGKMLGSGPVSNTRWALMVIIKYWEVSQQVVTAAANF